MDKVTVQVNAPDVINITSDAGDKITLSSTAMIVLPEVSGDTSDLISSDPDNDLKYGSDNKLLVATDELNTSFEYAASVTAFWSI
ncbi:hypothetical protein KZX29_11520 [Moraxella osloensis]|uniref:hypothetical protein n=1 Tax=Faucicola osloensis TaxID=34062 RepID=UPI002005A086|nr:hypothetical protein [Moraxella osloensis]MCK6159406.1 hypothetical protein [Moraxella osloensis]